MKLPAWAHGLRGAERFESRLRGSRKVVADGGWPKDTGPLATIGVTLPTNLRRWADEVDPLLPAYFVTETIRMLQVKLDEIVTVSRERGHSWSEIAQALGVSKQAAWERFGRNERSA